MVEDLIKFRNKLKNGQFRFMAPLEEWKANYSSRPGVEEADIVKIQEEGELKGYAIGCMSHHKGLRMYRILEFCATDNKTTRKLIDSMIRRGEQIGADFVIGKTCQEPFDSVFKETGFASIKENVVMFVLLNLEELLVPLSSDAVQGRVFTLIINGFKPLNIVVGKDKIRILGEKATPDIRVSLEARTFLRLFFGKTTVLKEVLRGNLRIEGKIHFNTIFRFFRIFKQNKWYIPQGDCA